jgi:polyhydroxybutyrate depolymerase
VILDTVGVDYQVQGGTLRIVGLSDLGQPESAENPYDACYDEDLDNYIDIILAGDEAAARSLTHVEVPSLEGGYEAFYNPGGPGRTPFEGVVYTAPGPADLEPIIIALDDPMRVTFPAGDTMPDDDTQTLDVDGVEREYLLNVPESYSEGTEVPLLFNLHALQGTAEGQLAASGLAEVAEREGFMLVTPQAVGGVWTVTGFPIDNGSDDLGFITALLAELSGRFTIDADRVYATGMSQGGFLSFELICNFSETFAAIASVSGVMTPPLVQSCTPARRVPVMQIHGTADDLIDYSGAETVVDFWVAFNGASPVAEITELPDRFPENGTTVERFVYAGGEMGVDVEHLKINGGGHVWPGADGDSDIDTAEEVWGFVSRYDLNGRID